MLVSGSLSTNKSELYTNLADALQWANFQVDLRVLPGPKTNLLFTSTNSTTARRRLQQLVQSVSTEAHTQRKLHQLDQLLKAEQVGRSSGHKNEQHDV